MTSSCRLMPFCTVGDNIDRWLSCQLMSFCRSVNVPRWLTQTRSVTDSLTELNALFTYACMCVSVYVTHTDCIVLFCMHRPHVVWVSAEYVELRSTHSLTVHFYELSLSVMDEYFTLSVAKFCIYWEIFPSRRIPFRHLLQLTVLCVHVNVVVFCELLICRQCHVPLGLHCS